MGLSDASYMVSFVMESCVRLSGVDTFMHYVSDPGCTESFDTFNEFLVAVVFFAFWLQVNMDVRRLIGGHPMPQRV